MDTILIVEDRESMSDMLKETLRTEGYRTITAKDGPEGIKKIKENRIDLVLTDLKLPRKNGIDVLMAAKEENPLMPVIVMTAFGSVETAVLAIKEGAFDFITKPFDTDHLLVLMKRALETQRLMITTRTAEDNRQKRKDIRSCPADTEGCAEQDNGADSR